MSGCGHRLLDPVMESYDFSVSLFVVGITFYFIPTVIALLWMLDKKISLDRAEGDNRSTEV